MADVEISALADSGIIQDTDLFVVSRAGAGKKVTGLRVVPTNAAGDSAMRGNAVLATSKRLLSVTAPLIGGDGGTNTSLFSGSTALIVRNAADSATLLTVANGGGISATGTLDVAGAIRQGGNQVWHAGNLAPSAYAALVGATFTGGIIFPTSTLSGGSGAAYLVMANTAGNYSIGLATGVDAWRVRENQFGVDALIITRTSAAVPGTFAAAGAITQAGNQVWHAGNFAPSAYAALAGATFTAGISVNTASDSKLTLRGSDNPKILGYDSVGTLNGVLQFSPGITYLTQATGSVVLQSGGVNTLDVASSGVNVTGVLNATGAIKQGGNQVWHAGNLNPSAYQLALGFTPANKAGDTFTGAFGRDATFTLDLSGGNPRITFDTGDYLTYDRTANKLTLSIGGSAVASIDSAGNLKVAGNITGATAP